MEPDLDLDRAREFREALRGHVRETPCVRSERLSRLAGRDVWLKCEGLQVTGSFKVRGALAALSALPGVTRVHACSAGNHGKGLAYASRARGVACRIVVPSSAPEVKARGIEELGAELVVAPARGYDAAAAWTREHADELGGTFVSAFEDPAVVLGGGGSLAFELAEQGPDFEAVLVPCGGGGLLSGIAFVLHHERPRTRVVGVNAEASPGMWRSRREGAAVLELDGEDTIADGLEGGVGARTFAWVERYADDVVLASEAGLRAAVRDLAREERLVVEGSGAAGVAALLEGRVGGDGPVCCVLTGSNIDEALLAELLEEPGS